jgi:hypothetical protein
LQTDNTANKSNITALQTKTTNISYNSPNTTISGNVEVDVLDVSGHFYSNASELLVFSQNPTSITANAPNISAYSGMEITIFSLTIPPFFRQQYSINCPISNFISGINNNSFTFYAIVAFQLTNVEIKIYQDGILYDHFYASGNKTFPISNSITFNIPTNYATAGGQYLCNITVPFTPPVLPQSHTYTINAIPTFAFNQSDLTGFNTGAQVVKFNTNVSTSNGGNLYFLDIAGYTSAGYSSSYIKSNISGYSLETGEIYANSLNINSIGCAYDMTVRNITASGTIVSPTISTIQN